MSQEDGKSSVGYFVAAAVLGAAVGNMFVARRMRSIMKMKVPTGENVTGKTASPAGAAERVNSNRARMAEEEAARQQARQAQRARDYHFQKEQEEQVKQAYERWSRTSYSPSSRPRAGPTSDVLSRMQPHLVTLELPTDLLPSRQEVKDAYARFALKTHPDRHPGVAAEVGTEAHKFQAGTEAHKTLLRQIDALETKKA
jgi:DnaJ domain